MAVAFVVPIVDVDSVHKGLSGKDQPPHVHNQDWAEDDDPDYPPTWFAVQALKIKIRSLTRSNNMLFFIDCHSPYYTDGPDNHWYVNERTAGNVACPRNFSEFGSMVHLEVGLILFGIADENAVILAFMRMTFAPESPDRNHRTTVIAAFTSNCPFESRT